MVVTSTVGCTLTEGLALALLKPWPKSMALVAYSIDNISSEWNEKTEVV